MSREQQISLNSCKLQLAVRRDRKRQCPPEGDRTDKPDESPFFLLWMVKENSPEDWIKWCFDKVTTRRCGAMYNVQGYTCQDADMLIDISQISSKKLKHDCVCMCVFSVIQSEWRSCSQRTSKWRSSSDYSLKTSRHSRTGIPNTCFIHIWIKVWNWVDEQQYICFFSSLHDTLIYFNSSSFAILCSYGETRRLRAGLCDRCTVTQEVAKRRQQEFEVSQMQTIQHITLLGSLSH